MTKVEQAWVVAWRLKILRYAQGEPRHVAHTCRHFGISRTLFYRWKRRFEAHGEGGPGRPLANAPTIATGDTTRGGAVAGRSISG